MPGIRTLKELTSHKHAELSQARRGGGIQEPSRSPAVDAKLRDARQTTSANRNKLPGHNLLGFSAQHEVKELFHNTLVRLPGN